MSQNVKRVAKATYSFAVDGGAVSTITPSVTDVIPQGAIVTDVTIQVSTLCTGGGGCTVAITGGGLTLVAAETLANNVLNATGVVRMIAAGNAGVTSTAPYISQLASSSATIKVVVGTTAVTAGVFNVFVEYVI